VLALYFSLIVHSTCCHLYIHSFPTRRSSDLVCVEIGRPVWLCASAAAIKTFSSSGVIFPSLEPISAMIPAFSFVPSIPCSISSRSEEHTSELQSRFDLVCRLLLEKKKISKDR